MFKLSSQKEKKKRINICEQCYYSEVNKIGLTCGKLGIKTEKTCGCLIFAKIQFADSKCPQNKWK